MKRDLVIPAFLDAAQDEHAQLRGAFVIYDVVSDCLYSAIRPQELSVTLSSADIAFSLQELTVKGRRMGGHARQMHAGINGPAHVKIGGMIAYYDDPVKNSLFGEEIALYYQLYHEMGHLVVKNALASDGTISGRNFRECAADVYALIRLRQKFPDTPAVFIEDGMVSLALMCALHANDLVHYTVYSVSYANRWLDNLDLKNISSSAVADLAFAIADMTKLNLEDMKALCLEFDIDPAVLDAKKPAARAQTSIGAHLPRNTGG